MRFRAHLAAASLLLSAVAVGAGPAPFACAGEGPEAALVVDAGGPVHRYCVALDAERVSGLHVIELAGAQHGLTYSFGYQGQAVCALAGVGSDQEECFEGGEPFWGYWRRSSSGGWTWSGTGAAGTSVEDGDVEGWSWGRGNDGNSHPQPPNTSHASVCGEADEPEGSSGGKSHTDPPETDEGSKGSKGSKGGSARDPSTGLKVDGDGAGPSEGTGSHADPSDDAASGREAGSKPDGKSEKRARREGEGPTRSATQGPAASPTPTSAPLESPQAAPAASSSPGGPPPAGVAGLVVAVLLGLAGAWFLKRKRPAAG